jgi:DNA-binding response OmpR family regulator
MSGAFSCNWTLDKLRIVSVPGMIRERIKWRAFGKVDVVKTNGNMTSVKTILFVENDPVSQTMYQKRLEREGFHLECAPDGQAALDILSERAPDLVLLDLMLPKVSGADVLKFMHADPRLTTVPVIIFSNAPMTEVPPDSPLGRGAKRLLKSDCTFPKLLQTIQETLAAAPEFVVVEAGRTSSAQSNGDGKGARFNVPASPDSEIKLSKQRAEFLKEALAIMPKIREHSMGYIKAPESEASQAHLSGLHQRVHLLNTGAIQADCARVVLLTTAFDALLTGIKEKPTTASASVLQTIAQGVDCLDGLLKNTDGYSIGPRFQARVLVVDDETVCNHVNVTSLKRANFDAVGVKDPAAALNLLETTQFDLIVLDVNMPGMTGFDVCEKLRRLPHCQKTPVLFVTAFSNFDNRKQSVLSGGNDFVSKPVSPSELVLKVSINLIKARVEGIHDPQSNASSHATNGSHDPSQPKQPAHPGAQSPEPSSRLAPAADLGIKNIKATNSPRMTPPEVQPRLPNSSEHTLPSKGPTPTNQESNGETPSAEIYERLRQSTAGLERAKAVFEQEAAERARLESQWREQVGAAKALIEQTETVLKQKEARCSQLEKELAGLQQVRDELQSKLATQQQAAAKSQQEIKDTQERLRQSTTELEQAKTASEKQTAEWNRQESEWREQLNAAKAASGKLATALKEKESRCDQLEKDLGGLQQVRDELQNKFAVEQQATAKSQQEIKNLKTSLEQQSAERARLESEWHEQQNAAKQAASEAETALKEREARCSQLEKDLLELRQVRDEFQSKFAAERQAAAKSQQEIKELQERLRQGSTELERAKAGLEEQSAERTRLESEWREQLNAAKAAASQTEAALNEKETRCGQLEKDLAGLQQVRDELQTKFAAEQQAVAKSQQEVKELQERLRQECAELERAKASLEQQSVERTRLESECQNLANAKGALNQELCSLRDSQMAQAAEWRNRHKKLADGLRENIHLLQSRLQEFETSNGGAGEISNGNSGPLN